MSNKKKIYYWSPFIDKVATIKAVYNSVNSLNYFSKEEFDTTIIDVFGEWKKNNFFNLSKINFCELRSIPILFRFSSLGFLRSRLKYIIIFIYSFFPLKKLLLNHKPDFLIIHLITSLPLILNYIYNFETKIILRISGKPKLNFLRYFFWKLFLKKVYKITFPTRETLEYFALLNIVNKNKLELLYDPVIETKKLIKKDLLNENFKFENKNFFLAIGRLTKQKNFLFLIECFRKIIKYDANISLVIVGKGEDYEKLNKFIKKNNLQDNIFLEGYKENIFQYLINCEAFVLSSLWEDPGFVLIEAMYANKIIISSDCSSGPKEIIGDKRGILFKSNSKDDFIKKFKIYKSLDINKKKNIIYNSKKFVKKFTLFNHHIKLKKILNK